MSDIPRDLLLFLLPAIALASPPQAAKAQHEDIHFTVEDGQIMVQTGGPPVWTSALLAPGFPPAPGDPPVQQDDPGFNAPSGSFTPGTFVGLSAVQPLWYWDGQMLAMPPSGTVLGVENVLGDFLFVDPSAVPEPPSLDFAVAGEEGGVHQHVVYHLPDPVSPDGAYGLVLELTTAGTEPSEPILIVLNQRLSGAQFDAGVEAILEAAGFLDADLLAGDYNGNGLVEQEDLDLVLVHWGSDGSTPPAQWTNDLPNGTIDQEELDGVLVHWGNMLGDARSSAAVPEPRALSLSVLLAVALACGRRAFRGAAA